MWRAANANEQPASLERDLISGLAVGQGNPALALVSVECQHFGMGKDLNVFRETDAIQRVRRARTFQRIAAQDYRHLMRGLGKVHGGLFTSVAQATVSANRGSDGCIG